MSTTAPGPRDLLDLAEHLIARQHRITDPRALADELTEVFGERTPSTFATLVQLGARAFHSRFGRPATEGEPFIWSPFELAPAPVESEHAGSWLAAVLVENGWPLAEVHAFERTGVVLFEHTWDELDDIDRFAWLEAVYEYQGSN